jgi:hypothetical protein
VLETTKDREILKFASDIINIVDPDWFKGTDAIEKNAVKNKSKKN